MAKKNEIFTPVRIVMMVLNMAAILLLLLTYACQWLNPQSFHKMAAFSVMYPYALILNIIFVIYWLMLKNRHMVWSVLAIAIGWGNVGKYLQLQGEELPQNADHLKIMSYNVHVMGVDNHSIHQKDSIIDFLAAEQPDIICLQEFYDRRGQNLQQLQAQSGLKHVYKSTCVTEGPDTYGLITLSRYPIIGHGDIIFNNSVGNRASYTDILVGHDTLRIYNVHLQSMHFASTDYSFAHRAANPSGMTKDEFKQGSLALAHKVVDASVKRSEQVHTLQEHMSTSPYKVILCGDFNDTPWSYAYHRLISGKKDAFTESGKGTGKSMTINKLFSFRIDYILHDKQIQSYNYATSRNGYSDHECVMASLTFANDKQ